MAIEVKLPSLGEGIDSGDVMDVLVSEGDTVEVDQPIVELETDKATVEVPSSHAGKVVKIFIESGQTIEIGAPILTVEAAVTAEVDDPPTAAAPQPEPPSETAATEPESTTPVKPESVTPPAPVHPAPLPEPPAAPAPAPQVPAAPAPAPQVNVDSPSQHDEDSYAAAGPAIRRFAREVGVEISEVQGTGPGGRITREDILAIVRNTGSQASITEETAPDAPPASTDQVSPQQQPPARQETANDASVTSDEWGAIDVERMTKIRKTISSKMHESWTSVPRVTNFDDADVTELEEIRQASKADYASRGIKLTQMPFLIKAVALSLKTNPSINAIIDESNQQIIYKKYVNVGIAIDTDRGLLVPSLRKPDQLTIPEIARTLGTMAENVRNNDFKLDDLRGSTFTISNLGAIGGTYSTPIVNVPEVAILLVGRSRKMPVVVDDEIQIRLMMPLSLSYDHRLVDGATAARFLNDVKAFLESPSRLLIAP